MCVLQSEGHDVVVVIATIGHECRFGRVQRIYFYLILARVNIHEIKGLVAWGTFKYHVNIG